MVLRFFFSGLALGLINSVSLTSLGGLTNKKKYKLKKKQNGIS